MKKKDIKDLPNKTTADLKKMLGELHMELVNTRLDLKLGKSKNTAILKEIKRDIARVLTVLNIQKGEEAKLT